MISDGIPTMLEGVPLPISKIEITVDREGFFLNPTGCDPRPLSGTFTSAGGKTATSSMQHQATGCDKLPFDPTLYMIAGERGKTNAGQNVHPPLTAIVTQKTGEAAISRARVLLPNILRPNVPFLNEPGALCTDAQAQARTCPPKSLVGSARVITPVLPFELNGPVHIVQEIGSILPKLYVYLRGGGFEVLLRARNRITGVRTENTFDFVPDVPQSYFELKIKGGNDGLLNNFYDLCDTPADSARRQVDATFNGHNGAVADLEVRAAGRGLRIDARRGAHLVGADQGQPQGHREGEGQLPSQGRHVPGPPGRDGQGHLGGKGLPDPEAEDPHPDAEVLEGRGQEAPQGEEEADEGLGDNQGDGVERRPPRRDALLQAPLALAADQAALAQQRHHLVGAGLG